MAPHPHKKIYPTLARKVFIAESAIIVGDVIIDEDCSIWPSAVLRGDVNHIQLGKRTNIQDGSVLHVGEKSQKFPMGHPLLIGEEVTIGHRAILHGCCLGNRILVGMGAIILDGAILEDEVLIGAGSLVPPNKTLQSGFLYLGSPAKRVRPLTAEEKAFFKQSALNYVELKNQYLLENVGDGK